MQRIYLEYVGRADAKRGGAAPPGFLPGRRFELSAAPLLVARRPHLLTSKVTRILVLDDETVSNKRHCRIWCLPGKDPVVEDLGSGNGTWVSPSRRLNAKHAVRVPEGARMRVPIGTHVFIAACCFVLRSLDGEETSRIRARAASTRATA